MPFPSNIRFYIENNILTQKQAEALSDPEIQALNTEFARQKILNGIEHVTIHSLSEASGLETDITQSFIGREAMMFFLEGPAQERTKNMQFFMGIQAAIDDKILSIEQATRMSSKNIFVLANRLFRVLIVSGEVGFDAESGEVTIEQYAIELSDKLALFTRLEELQTYIEQSAHLEELAQHVTLQGIFIFKQYKYFFTHGILTLEELLHLTEQQVQSLENLEDFVRESFIKPIVGRNDSQIISNLLQRETQIPAVVHDMMKDNIIAKNDVLNFPDIEDLSRPLCSLVVRGKISLREVQALSKQQKAYLSSHNAHDLILANIVTPQQVYQLKPEQLIALERLSFGKARIENLSDLFGDNIGEIRVGYNFD